MIKDGCLQASRLTSTASLSDWAGWPFACPVPQNTFGADAVGHDILLIYCQTEDLEQLQVTLEQSKMTVVQVENAQDVMTSLTRCRPSFLLLDFDVENAERFLQEISKSVALDPPPYILIADAFLDAPDRATVLDLGADACVAKPISPQEVVALIRAVLRREHKMARLQAGRLMLPIEHKDLKIDRLHRKVTMRGADVSLAPKEYDILKLLAENPGSVLTKEVIYEKVWKENPEFEASRVADNIHSLRQKLGLDSKDTDYIQTVHRIGYRFAQYE